ncbi:MAG TPA: glycosyltransferase family 9 protein, partial [Candidatus Obscuribacter sp.]|nr:glycosyltransferase family 9 protein [Candidatus Obscuribacter sp.]
CPAIDEFIEFDKELGFFQQRKVFKGAKPDLFIDLSNSTRGIFLSLLGGCKSFCYQKKPDNGPDQQHAVGNFLETIQPICKDIPDSLFPTIFPDAIAEVLVPQLLETYKFELRPMIGIVPGVGAQRPHRSWILDGWIYLVRHILSLGTHQPVLIGGADDFETAQKINEESGDRCLNFCGQLKLDETAAILKCCDIVISGDTGPAHIAVAVGRPVIGLYGPTYPARSGPYGCFNMVLDQSSSCECHGEKSCHLAGPGSPGECMGRIMLPEVIDMLSRTMGNSRSVGSFEEANPPGVFFDEFVLREMQSENAAGAVNEAAEKPTDESEVSSSS